jgi:hypothetical protein
LFADALEEANGLGEDWEMNTQLPYWVQMVAALGPLFAALTTLMVGVIVASIAYRQWQTAKEKLILDLFDRRMNVYQKLRQSISLVNASGKVSDEAERLFLEAENEAVFLFEQDIHAYLRDLWLIYVNARVLTRKNGLPAQDATAHWTKLMEATGDF